MNACTITIRRRWPFARTLANSYLANHPGEAFTVLVIDTDLQETRPGDGIDVAGPGDIGIGPGELHAMALLWPFEELRAAMIPRLLSHLIESSGGAWAYFADDTKIFGRLGDLERMSKEFGLLLALRSPFPLPADRRTPNEHDLIEAGIYDDGFVGAGPGCEAPLEWWIERTSLHSAARPQVPPACRPFLQLAPSFFPHKVVSDPGFGVSYWNVGSRTISEASEKYRIDQEPLQTFRFDGFDPEKPYLIGPQGPEPRLLLSERTDLGRLVRRYLSDLNDQGLVEAGSIPYRFSELADAVPVDDRIRSVYRKALHSVTNGKPGPPDPFENPAQGRFIDWLNSPDPDSKAPLVSRYLLELYEERLDLHLAFPGVSNAGAAKYLDWVVRYGESEAGIAPALAANRQEHLGRLQNTDREKATSGDGSSVLHLPDGVNISGYFNAELGVGEMARLILLAFQRTPLAISTYAYHGGFSRRHHPFRPVGKAFAFNTNLICVNADQLGQFVMDTGTRYMEGRYNIGLWWWEVDVLPRNIAGAADFLDEIWVGTQHVAGAVRAASEKPVFLIPPPIRPISAGPVDRKSLGIPQGFMFLFTFDFLSVEERKNPLGVIHAFRKAFPRPEPQGPVLVIKSINGDLRSMERLKMAADGRGDIRILDGYMPPQTQDALIAACDCYVSLHRSEGYGLGMAEAMALGRPIIATGYSGNMDFLSGANSYLVRYELVPIPPGYEPYPQGAHWADPDLNHAAELMRLVWEKPEDAAARGAQAQREARTLHTPERTAEFIAERMEEVLDTQRRRREYEELRLRGGTRLTLLREGLRGFVKGPVPPQ